MIKVTAHAKQRFRERFRLQFNPEIFRGGNEAYMLRKLFREAKSVDFALRQCPGRYNALCVKHGRKVRISKVRNIVFVHSEVSDEAVIYTVLQEGSYLADMKF